MLDRQHALRSPAAWLGCVDTFTATHLARHTQQPALEACALTACARLGRGEVSDRQCHMADGPSTPCGDVN